MTYLKLPAGMEVLQIYRFNGSGDDQWEEIHNAHKSSDNNLQVTKKRISWHKYPRFPCSKTIVLLSLCGKAQIARNSMEGNDECYRRICVTIRVVYRQPGRVPAHSPCAQHQHRWKAEDRLRSDLH